ncbi:MAG: FG-GAP-like repeat-containing protein [bacterium]|nr:FG-GAP-like repeat-containing protein [bacterium]
MSLIRDGFSVLTFLTLLFSIFFSPLTDEVRAANQNKLIVSEVSGYPNLFSPNGDGNLDSSYIEASVNIKGTGETVNAVLHETVRIEDRHDSEILTISLEKSLDIPVGDRYVESMKAEWKGMDAAGNVVPDGPYVFTTVFNLLKGCKGKGDNRDDLKSGKVDLTGDCNSGEGSDSKEAKVIASTQSISGEINIDNTAPVITVKGISEGSVTNKDVTITISIEELHPSSQSITLNNQPFTSGSTLTEEGQYVLSVIAKDMAENIAISSITFTIDKTAPLIGIASPPAEAFLNDPAPEIKVEYSDALSGIDLSAATIALDGIDVTGSARVTESGLTCLPTFQLPEGVHTITASVSDKAGNVSNHGITFTVDLTPPDIGILLPSDGSPINNDVPEISVQYADALTGIDVSTAVVKLNGLDITGEAALTETGITYTPSSPLFERSYTITASVSDKAGNNTNHSITFIVDKTSPLVDFVSPEDGATIDNATPEISIEFSDKLSGVDLSSVSLSISDIDVTLNANISENSLSYMPDSPLEEGDYTASISLSDRAGNMNESTLSFNVQSSCPKSVPFNDSAESPFIFPEPGFELGAYEFSYSTPKHKGSEFVDVNNDCINDMVLLVRQSQWRGTGRSKLSVVLGKSDGTFESPVTFGDVSGYGSMVVDDFNGDSFPDIVMSNTYTNSWWGERYNEVRVYLNNQDSSYTLGYEYQLDYLNGFLVGGVMSGNFDQDSSRDIVLFASNMQYNSNDRRIFTFSGNGDGSIDKGTETKLDGVNNMEKVETTDLNNDGITDIVVAWPDKIALLTANGDGTFVNSAVEDLDLMASSFALTDLDRDGYMDVVATGAFEGDNYASSQQWGYLVLFGDGDGGIKERKSDSFLISLNTNNFKFFLNDQTGDDFEDLILVNNNSQHGGNIHQGGNIYVVPGNGDGTFNDTSPIKSIIAHNDWGMIRHTDMDKDGKGDIVNIHEDHVFILFGRDDGTFTDRKEILAKYGEKQRIISADFDGDKTPDLAMAGGSEGALFSTILNKGSGWTESLFRESSRYRVGDGPSSVKVSDLNGDGKPDVITTNYFTNDISVLLNTDEGSLEVPVTYSVGERPHSVITEDMNGDGHLDIIVASKSKAHLTILFGAGNGTFPVKKELNNNGCYSMDGSGNPNSLLIADYNEDNIPDIVYFGCVANNYSTNTLIMIGHGDGNFQTTQMDGISARYGVSGDYNEDGRLDLAFNDGSYIKLLFGRGDGTFIDNNIKFSDRTPYLFGADFNKDGHQDFISRYNLYSGDGRGGFQTAELDDISFIGGYLGEIQTKIADLNGDGEADILVDTSQKMDLWLASGDGSFEKKSSIEYLNFHNNGSYGLLFGNTIDVGDINGDSVSDIIFVDGASLYVLAGSGNGMFPGRTDYIGDGWETGDNVAAADFNGDANQDIAVSISNGDKHRVSVYLGRGDNTFMAGATIDIPDASSIRERYIYSEDFNNDGLPDILYQQVSISDYLNDKLYVFLNMEDGTFGEALSYSTPRGSEIILHDVDGDEFVDIVSPFTKLISWNDYDLGISIHKGTGTGSFSYEATLPIGNYSENTKSYVALKDFNGDGHADIAVSKRIDSNSYNFSSDLMVFINDGDGSFTTSPIINEVKNINGFIITRDFDQDGTTDLVTNGYFMISFLSGNGDGTFKPSIEYATSYIPQANLISEDFNLDGRPDIATGGDIQLLLNTSPPLYTPLSVPSTLRAVAGDKVVMLTWKAVMGDDVDGYNIYRGLVSGGGYEKINSVFVSSPAFTDTSVTNGTEYYYTVSAVDKDGEESSYAFKVRARPDVPDTTAPVVKITTPVLGQNLFNPSIFVSGTVNEAEAEVTVNRIAGTVQKNAGTFTAYDIPLNIGENTVSVTAVDAAGNSSSDSITVVYMPPATMEGIIKDEVTGQPVEYARVFVIDSEKTQELHRTGADGKYSFLKIIPGEVSITVTPNSWNYESVTISKTISSGENLSLDIALPLYPASIRGYIYDSYTYDLIGSATVSIKDPKKTQTLNSNDYGYFESYNIAPYEVTITISKDGYEPYTKTYNLTNQYTNYLYFYLDSLPPAPPTDVQATPGIVRADLSWNANSEGNLDYYNIYRSTVSGTGYTLVDSVPYDTTSYADTEVTGGTTYYYVVTAVNTSSMESEHSAELMVVPDQIVAPSAPTGLNALPDKGRVDLAWDQNSETEVEGYKLYRTTSSGSDYTLIASLSDNELSYSDTGVEGGVTYYYVLTAVNSWSLESAWSEEVSAVPETIIVLAEITSPFSGSYLYTSSVTVMGTVESLSPEAGVVIVVEAETKDGPLARSYLAHYSDGSFAAEVELFSDASTQIIKAIATIPSGEFHETSVTVYKLGALDVVKLTAAPTSGIIAADTGDFEVTFEAEFTGSGAPISYSWDFDGDGSEDSVTTAPGPVTYSYTFSGLFTPEVTVTLSDNTEGLPTRDPFVKDPIRGGRRADLQCNYGGECAVTGSVGCPVKDQVGGNERYHDIK